MGARYSIRRLHLRQRQTMASELGVKNSPKLDDFERLAKQHAMTLKVTNRNGDLGRELLAAASLLGIRCWLARANVAYLFTNEIVLQEWSRKQYPASSDEELFVSELRAFLLRYNRNSFEMASDNYLFQFGGPTRIMGILNLTPDSFYDGGRYADAQAAIARGLQMEQEGADIIDIGGESTRPGSLPVPEDQELARVIPVISGLVNELQIPISIDTYKAPVAEAAIQAGATIVNDISGLAFDPNMIDVIKHYGVPVVLMHIKGRPHDMQVNPNYDNLMDELYWFFEDCIARAEAAGLSRDRIIVDPGLGFGKRLWDNYEILQRLPEFRGLGCPILVGPSRKSFIGKILDLPVGERLEGTAAAVAAAIAGGCHLLRVHDVKEMLRVIQITDLVFGNVVLQEEDVLA